MNQQTITNTKEYKDQRLYCFTLGVLLSFTPFITLLNNICSNYLYEGFIYDTVLCYGLVWALVGICICKCFSKMRFDMWLFLAAFVSYWAYTYLCMPINRYFMYQSYMDIVGNPLYILYVYSFSGYIIVRAITDYEMLENTLRRFSVATVWISIMLFLFDFYINETQTNYMVFSYNMLFHITFLVLGETEGHTRGHRLLGYIGLMFALVLGCRGALVSFGVSFILKLFFSKKPTLTKIVQVVTMASLLVVVIFFFEETVTWMIQFTDSLGIDSRTLLYMQEGRFFEDSGRDIMQQSIIDELNWAGNGMYGDRLTNDFFGSYAHNIFIEFISHYGYLLGSLLSVSLVFTLMRGVFFENHKLRMLVIVFISTGFIKLLLSSSYLSHEPSFYILLGLCTSRLSKKSSVEGI